MSESEEESSVIFLEKKRGPPSVSGISYSSVGLILREAVIFFSQFLFCPSSSLSFEVCPVSGRDLYFSVMAFLSDPLQMHFKCLEISWSRIR